MCFDFFSCFSSSPNTTKFDNVIYEKPPEQSQVIIESQEQGQDQETQRTCKGLLFGLNYHYCSTGKLSGCINDVHNVHEYLSNTFQMPCDVYTDDINQTNTSYKGILRNLQDIAADSHKYKYKYVWLHYSGHGSYQTDRTGDEADGMDECLVPSDYETVGMISDDLLLSIFKTFYSETRIIFMFDCCHSGTIADLKYSFELDKTCTIENKATTSTVPKMISLSGCLDDQVSMDVYGAFAPHEFSGAMSACLLLALKETPALCDDVFALLSDVRDRLKAKGFKQIPKLAASYDLRDDPTLIPK